MRTQKAIYRLNFPMSLTKRQEQFCENLIGADRWVYNSMLAYSEFTYLCGEHHDRDINAARNILKIGLDTPEYKPVEKLTSGLFQKKQAKVGSVKQEPKVSTADQKSV